MLFEKQYRRCIHAALVLVLLTHSTMAIIPPNTTVNVQHPSFNLDYRVKSAHLDIKLFTGETYTYGDHPFAVTVAFEVLAFDGNNNQLPSVFDSSSYTLTVNEKTPEQVFQKRFDNWMNQTIANDDIARFEINVTNVVYDTINTPLAIRMVLANDIDFQADYTIDYGVHYIQNATTQIPSIDNLFFAGDSSPVEHRIVNFTWNNGGHLFPNYEFQLLRLYNTHPGNTISQESIQAEINWNKALTIETQSSDTALTLTIAEGTGYYAWRVRPIGSYYDDGIANNQNWGNWSNIPTGQALQNTTVSFISAFDINDSALGNAYPYFYYVDPDEDKNWIYSRTFTEGNPNSVMQKAQGTRVSEQINYANGLLQTQQTQGYLPSNDARITNQTIWDYSSRAALTTLPVPSEGERLTGYQQQFVLTPSDSLYTADYFDRDSNLYNPAKVNDNPGKSFEYYSGNYTDDKGNIAGNQGYAYSRIIYYDDGTGRVKESGAIGEMHALGDQDSTDRGRTVRTMYTIPSDEELIRIFGDEAPKANAVLKTITIDQNNTTSITYASKQGYVIATCLVDNPHENPVLLSLADTNLIEPETGLDMTIVDSVNQNIESNGSFKAIKRLAFTEPTVIQIDYKINCSDSAIGCATTECAYDLTIKIRYLDNLEDTTVNRTFTQYIDGSNCVSQTNGNGYLTSFFDENGATVNSPLSLTLPEGSYSIEKTLTPSVNTDDLGGLASGNASAETQPYVDLVLHWLDEVSTPADLAVFNNNLADFPNSLTPIELNDYFTTNGITPSGSTMYLTYLSGEPDKLILSTACCPNLEVPLGFTFSYDCSDVSTWRKYNNGGAMDFEGYLATVFQENFGMTVDYATVLPGYAPGQVNEMIWHMLNDEYSCDSAGIGTPTVQYACEDVWSCWINMVSGYVDLTAGLRGDYSVEDGSSTGNGAGTDVEDSETGVGSGSNSSYETNFDENNQGGFIERFVGRFMGRYMRRQGLRTGFEFSIIEQFIQCTGYKFAKVITPTDPFPLNADQNNPGQIPRLNYTAQPSPVFLQNNHIFDPVFAFKYYHYDSPNPGSNTTSCEKLYCFAVSNAPITPCDPVACTTDYTSWTCTQRERFYQCLEYSQPALPPDSTNNTTVPTTAQLDSMADAKTAFCEDRCEARRGEFRDDVIDMFVTNCYTIGQCNAGTNNVSWATIDTITNQLVLACNGMCQLTRPNANSFTCNGTTYMEIAFNHCELVDWGRALTSPIDLGITSVCSGGGPSPLCGVNTPANDCIDPNVSTVSTLTVTVSNQ